MKRFLTILLAATLLLTLCACESKEKDKENDPSITTTTARFEAPDNVEDLATQFIRAYYLKDLTTQHNLLLHDARQEWEERQLKDHQTEEAFCSVVQQQANEQGLDVNIRSFDDYLREFHKRCLEQMPTVYGEYTLSITVTGSVKMNDEELADFVGELSGGFFSPYIEEAQLANITEGYVVTVDYSVDGELKDYHQAHTVKAVKCDGQWRVGTYTS